MATLGSGKAVNLDPVTDLGPFSWPTVVTITEAGDVLNDNGVPCLGSPAHAEAGKTYRLSPLYDGEGKLVAYWARPDD